MHSNLKFKAIGKKYSHFMVVGDHSRRAWWVGSRWYIQGKDSEVGKKITSASHISNPIAGIFL